jgi:hypothetical protein
VAVVIAAKTSIRRESIECHPEAVPSVRPAEASVWRHHRSNGAITTRRDAALVGEAMYQSYHSGNESEFTEGLLARAFWAAAH